MSFIQTNMGNIVVGSILVAVLFLALRKIIKDRKAGGCGCGCTNCPSAGCCHTTKKEGE